MCCGSCAHPNSRFKFVSAHNGNQESFKTTKSLPLHLYHPLLDRSVWSEECCSKLVYKYLKGIIHVNLVFPRTPSAWGGLPTALRGKHLRSRCEHKGVQVRLAASVDLAAFGPLRLPPVPGRVWLCP